MQLATTLPPLVFVSRIQLSPFFKCQQDQESELNLKMAQYSQHIIIGMDTLSG